MIACRHFFWSRTRPISRIPQIRHLTLSYNTLHDGEKGKHPVVIMHGLLGNKYNFNTVGKMLGNKSGNTIISCDVRNHGESPHSDEMNYKLMSEDILDLLETLKIHQCILLGHSMGGRIAMYTALMEPNRVHKLIAVDISPGSKDHEHGMSEGPLKYIEAMKLVKWRSGIKRSQARKEANEQLMKDIPDRTIRNFVLTNLITKQDGSYGWRINLEAISHHAKELHYLQDGDKFPPYTGKTYFLRGELSDYILPKDYPEIRRLFPNSVIHHIPGSGHWVHADSPRQFVSCVAEFLNNNTSL